MGLCQRPEVEILQLFTQRRTTVDGLISATGGRIADKAPE
jgi:hypothetical protein